MVHQKFGSRISVGGVRAMGKMPRRHPQGPTGKVIGDGLVTNNFHSPSDSAPSPTPFQSVQLIRVTGLMAVEPPNRVKRIRSPSQTRSRPPFKKIAGKL